MTGDDRLNIEDLGFDIFFQRAFAPYNEKGYSPARVWAEYKHIYRLYTEYGELQGEISGKMKYSAEGSGDYPAIGDWVVINPMVQEGKAIIHDILPRKSKFSRKAAGVVTDEQIVAANADDVFLVTSLNKNFNMRRLERYLTIAWESGANPVIVLSKADLCGDIDEKIKEVESIAYGVPAFAVSSVDGRGMDDLGKYLIKGKTTALIGSSGVGKSTLINCISGRQVLKVQDIRESDDRGRHTTTHRELVLLENGAIVMDTPGMREIQLWDGEDGIDEAFTDIEELSKGCRFRNCTHTKEPDCQVKKAILIGTLSPERLENYRKLQKELLYAKQKQEKSERIIAKKNSRSNKTDVRNNKIISDIDI